MIILTPPDYWVVTAPEIIEVETALYELDATLAASSAAEKFLVGQARIKAAEAMGTALVETLALAALAAIVTQAVNWTNRKQRRKKKTEICVSKCLGIIESVREDLAPMIKMRALQTDTEAPRKIRSFESRA